MYNRYIPNGGGYTRYSEPENPPPPSSSTAHAAPPPPPSNRPKPDAPLLPKTGLSDLLGLLRLEELDSGDVLLVLILLFLFRDGDDAELLITLGLLLLLGLNDPKKPKDNSATDC